MKGNENFLRLFLSVNLLFFSVAFTYRPEGKPDPFAPLSLIRPTLSGTTRLQQHEISEFELVGTLFGKEPSALLMTPDPKEGIIARIGDRIGRHGGRIVSITRDRVLTREPSANSVPGQNIQFTDIVINLSKSKVTQQPAAGGVDNNTRRPNDALMKPRQP